MRRRAFVRLLAGAASTPTPLSELRRGLAAALRAKADKATASLAGTLQSRSELPALRVVTGFGPAKIPGMPGPYPGRVVSVKSDRCVDSATGAAHDETVREMMARGDGLRGVWHGGPFARTTRYVFYPRQMLFGTDPVAIDRLLLDIIEKERRARGAISIWDRSASSLRMDDSRARDADPNVNIIIREPGHVEYASTLGLGTYDRARIRVQDVTV